MNIGIVGMGFVGGTTAKVFEKAHNIFPYDRYKKPYDSPGNVESLVKNSEVVFICVPTPMKPRGEIDYEPMIHSLDLLTETTRKIGRNYRDLLVTIRSTAASGSTDKFAQNYPFRFAFNPEFLVERTAMEDMLNTKRVVLGVEDEESERKLRAVYEPLFPSAEYVITNRKTAEYVKQAANATLATQIMIANQLELIAKALGVDYNEAIRIVQMDERIGQNMQVPGPDGYHGFGGKCLPKDLRGLADLARQHGVEPYLLNEVWRFNQEVREVKDWENIPGAVSSNNNFKTQ